MRVTTRGGPRGASARSRAGRPLVLGALLVTAALPAGAARAPGPRLEIRGAAPLRAGPSTSAPALETLRDASLVLLDGPAEWPWTRVRSTTGRVGFVAGRLEGTVLAADESLVGTRRPEGDVLLFYTRVLLRNGPAPGRDRRAFLEEGTTARVVGRRGTWVHLIDPSGLAGWADLDSIVSVPVTEERPPTALAGDVPPGGAPPAEAVVADGSTEEAGEVARREADRLEREAREAEEETRAGAEAEAEAEADRRARDEQREREKAEEKARRDAERVEREARRAEEKALEEAERKARDEERARERAEEEARREAERLEREAREAEEQARAEAERRAREEQRALEKAEAEARREAERLEREALRAEEKAREEAERRARDEERARERAAEDAARARRRAAEQDRTPPVLPSDVPPVALPPSLGIALDDKAPAARKADPALSPLASEPVAPASAGPGTGASDAPAAEQAEPAQAPAAVPDGFEPFDEDRQLDRSVSSLHVDEDRALDLSLTPLSEVDRKPSTHVTETGETVPARVVSEIVLRVGPEIVTSAEYERRLDEVRDRQAAAPDAPTSQESLHREVLRELINDLLLVNQARNLGLRFDRVYEAAKEEFKQKSGIRDDIELFRLLEAMGMTWADFKREMIRRRVPWVVIRDQVADEIRVDDEEVESYYRRHVADWSRDECVRLSEIVLQPRARETTRDFHARLQGLLRDLASGGDFCATARAESRSDTAASCGAMDGCFAREQLDEKVAAVVFAMEPGDVEPVRTDWGYHVLRLEGRQAQAVRTLEEVREEIVRLLRRDRLNVRIPRYIEDLRRAATIVVAPEYRRYVEGLVGPELGQ